MTEAFVYDAVRTPRGRGKDTGSLHGTKPVSLVVGLIDEVRKRNPGLDPAQVEDIILGRRLAGRRAGRRHRPHRGAGRGLRGLRHRASSSTGSAPPAWRR